MDDHAVVAGLSRRISDYLGEDDLPGAGAGAEHLARFFSVHAQAEEAGLFAALVGAGRAVRKVQRLMADHRRILALLSDRAVADDPARLLAVLEELEEHVLVEDTYLLPFAAGVLPGLGGEAGEAVVNG